MLFRSTICNSREAVSWLHVHSVDLVRRTSGVYGLSKEYKTQHQSRRLLRKATPRAFQQRVEQVGELSGQSPKNNMRPDGHYVLGPKPNSKSSHAPQVLLVLMPGAALKPEDYIQLIDALQAVSDDDVQLWVGCAAPTWQQIGWDEPDATERMRQQFDAAVEALRDLAVAQGFQPQAIVSGRWENMVVLAHSLAAQFAPRVAGTRGGALILLGSYLFPSSDEFCSLNEWARPVLHLCGDVDGQVRAARLASVALESAVAAFRGGKRWAATTKPVVLLPGVNHGHLSNGVLKAELGDIAAASSHAEAAGEAATVVREFLAANFGAEGSSARAAAVDGMVERATATIEYLSPYTETLGRGCFAQLWAAAAESLPQPAATPVLPGGVIAGAVGAEVLDWDCPGRRFLAHPGELAEAAAFCEAAQRHLAPWLPADSAHRLHVVPTVHTDEARFTVSQPTISKGLDGTIIVHTHMLLHRANLVKYGHRNPPSPQYFLKLRSGAALKKVLEMEHISQETNKSSPPSARSIHSRALTEVLALAPERARQRYLERGKRLVFVEDRNVTKDIKTPVDWIKNMQITFTDRGDGTTEVCSPILEVPVGPDGPGRFDGQHYMKCASRALLMEWIMTDCLRPIQQSS